MDKNKIRFFYFLFLFLAIDYSSIGACDEELKLFNKKIEDVEIHKIKFGQKYFCNASNEDVGGLANVFLAGGFFSADLYRGLGIALICPYYFPYDSWDAGYSVSMYFSPYPYYLKNKGYLKDQKEDFSKSWVYDIDNEYKIFRNENFGMGLNFDIRNRSRIEFQGEVNYISDLSVNGKIDKMYLGNANILFRFAQNQYLLMRSGLGVNAFLSKEDSYHLFYSYSVDVYPIKPLYCSARIDLGLIGRTSFFRLRTGIGLLHKRLEVNGGVEMYHIGRDSLIGFYMGAKLYF
jgi:hypothetical protein